MKKTDILFVYGTLQQGRPGLALMRLRQAEYLGKATLQGYALYDLHYYPGIVEDISGSVLGEAYRVSDEALVVLDKYENEGELFNRTLTSIRIKDVRNAQAHVYVYSKSVEDRQRVEIDRQPWGKEDIS